MSDPEAAQPAEPVHEKIYEAVDQVVNRDEPVHHEEVTPVVEKQCQHRNQCRPSGNAAPLGMNAFALTLLVFSLMNAGGLVNIHSDNGVVMGLALFYGGIGQIIAGMWEFHNGTSFGATLFTSYGAFFMSLAALRMKCFSFLSGYTNTRDVHDGMGIFYFGWTFFTLFMTIASHRTNFFMFVFLLFVFINFLLLTISEFTVETFPVTSINCQEGAGCFGVMAAFFGWYAAYSTLLTKKVSFFTLPIGSFNALYKDWGWLNEDEKSA